MSESVGLLGSLVALWRYPVKSMLGEELNASVVTERGLPGDRAYAVVNPAEGRIGSVKIPWKWGKLFDFRASYPQEPRPGGALPAARIAFPDGTMVLTDDPRIDAMLSEVLGREVRLVSAPPEGLKLETAQRGADQTAPEFPTRDYPVVNPFFDLAALHLLTTASLDRLRELYPQGRFEARRFRPNIVVGTPEGERGFVENGWVGKTLAIGEEVRIRVISPTVRCSMPTLPQGDLPRDPGILRTAREHNQQNVGAYAMVVRGGVVRRGDAVTVDSG